MAVLPGRGAAPEACAIRRDRSSDKVRSSPAMTVAAGGDANGTRRIRPVQAAYKLIAGRRAIAARQRSSSGCASSGIAFTTRAKSTATTAVMSATLKASPATN